MRLPAPRERWPDRCGKGPSGSPQPPSPRTPPAGGAGGGRPPTGPPHTWDRPLHAPELRGPRGPPRDPPPISASMVGEPTVISPPRRTRNTRGPPKLRGGLSPTGTCPDPPPAAPPGPEQILGARLRLLGDAFQHSYERQRRGRGLFWGPLFRWVAPWLGAAPAAPLAARGGN